MERTTLYDDDIILWSEQQADVLRRLGRARRDLPNDLDLDNVIEEIESVGREQLHAVESLLVLLFVHLIKLATEPQSDAVRHWRSEVLNWQGNLTNRFTPSMAQRIEVDKLWRQALRQATAASPEVSTREWPDSSPVRIEDFLGETFDLDRLIVSLTR